MASLPVLSKYVSAASSDNLFSVICVLVSVARLWLVSLPPPTQLKFTIQMQGCLMNQCTSVGHTSLKT